MKMMAMIMMAAGTYVGVNAAGKYVAVEEGTPQFPGNTDCMGTQPQWPKEFGCFSPTKELVFLGWSPVEAVKPLQECEGDCDSDSDCGEGLVCFKRRFIKTPIPGCINGGEGDRRFADYCVDPDVIDAPMWDGMYEPGEISVISVEKECKNTKHPDYLEVVLELPIQQVPEQRTIPGDDYCCACYPLFQLLGLDNLAANAAVPGMENVAENLDDEEVELAAEAIEDVALATGGTFMDLVDELGREVVTTGLAEDQQANGEMSADAQAIIDKVTAEELASESSSSSASVSRGFFPILQTKLCFIETFKTCFEAESRNAAPEYCSQCGIFNYRDFRFWGCATSLFDYVNTCRYQAKRTDVGLYISSEVEADTDSQQCQHYLYEPVSNQLWQQTLAEPFSGFGSFVSLNRNNCGDVEAHGANLVVHARFPCSAVNTENGNGNGNGYGYGNDDKSKQVSSLDISYCITYGVVDDFFFGKFQHQCDGVDEAVPYQDSQGVWTPCKCDHQTVELPKKKKTKQIGYQGY